MVTRLRGKPQRERAGRLPVLFSVQHGDLGASLGSGFGYASVAARTLGVRADVNPERVTRGRRPRHRFEGT